MFWDGGVRGEGIRIAVLVVHYVVDAVEVLHNQDRHPRLRCVCRPCVRCVLYYFQRKHSIDSLPLLTSRDDGSGGDHFCVRQSDSNNRRLFFRFTVGTEHDHPHLGSHREARATKARLP